MRKGITLIMGLAASMKIFAFEAIDVFGLDEVSAQKIVKKYSKEIGKLEPMITKELAQLKSSEEISKSLEKKLYKKHELQQEIIKKNGFLFVEFHTIYYPDDDRYYTTIEVVDKQHPERMRFVSKSTNNTEKSLSYKPDVIDAMNEYNNISVKMIINHQLAPPKSCPVYHCFAGFEHSKLKPYLPLFNRGVIKNKKLIVKTLKYDKDPERRAAAAFLVGHFTDPNEIISVLTPSVTDRNDGVRNNVMRVIAATMDKANITNIDVRPFLNVLDSPYTTDRNKALFVLENAANGKYSKNMILKKGGDKLLAILQLQQPNNHEFAYVILKKISGKDFGTSNIAAWKNWYRQYEGERRLV